MEPPRSDAPGVRVQRVGVDRLVDLRIAVLRPGSDRAGVVWDSDHAPTAVHVAAIEGGTPDDPSSGEVVAISSIGIDPAPAVVDRPGGEDAWRVRGVASAPSRRGSGSGRLVVEACTDAAWVAGAPLVWCNARTGARDFYLHLGWVEHGDVFDIPEIGPHVVMSIARGDHPRG
jgi:GNAT superfamily N-acetyltransferase